MCVHEGRFGEEEINFVKLTTIDISVIYSLNFEVLFTNAAGSNNREMLFFGKCIYIFNLLQVKNTTIMMLPTQKFSVFLTHLILYRRIFGVLCHHQ
jgi:hypothetical protein